MLGVPCRLPVLLPLDCFYIHARHPNLNLIQSNLIKLTNHPVLAERPTESMAAWSAAFFSQPDLRDRVERHVAAGAGAAAVVVAGADTRAGAGGRGKGA